MAQTKKVNGNFKSVQEKRVNSFFIELKIKLGFVLSLNEIKNLNVNLYSKSINIERLKNNPIKRKSTKIHRISKLKKCQLFQ